MSFSSDKRLSLKSFLSVKFICCITIMVCNISNSIARSPFFTTPLMQPVNVSISNEVFKKSIGNILFLGLDLLQFENNYELDLGNQILPTQNYNLTIELVEVKHIYGYVGDYVNHWYQIDDELYNSWTKFSLKVSNGDQINLISTSCDCNEKHVDRDDKKKVIHIDNLKIGHNSFKVVTKLYENRGKYAGHSAEYHLYYNVKLEKSSKNSNSLTDQLVETPVEYFDPKQFVKNYFSAIKDENLIEAVDYFSENVNRYYYKNDISRDWIYETMENYRIKSQIDEVLFDIDYNSFNTYQASSGNRMIDFNMTYKIVRVEKNKPSKFELKIYMELNNNNKIVSLYEEIIDKN